VSGQRQSAKRAIVLVLDACGVGALPDADLYGDAGTNTLGHLAEAVGGLRLPVLERLGLGSILPLAGVTPAEVPAIYGRLHALGPGKDSTAGHWELMGIVMQEPQPTYPEGLPEDLRQRLADAIGRELICNRPRNGIAAIEEFGGEHTSSGALILYTSQDSVLQLAAHVEVVPTEGLYAACEIARAQMQGKDAVGRVIARPFTGAPGAFERTDGRHDFSLRPPGRSYIDELSDRGIAIHGVGKVVDLFAEDPAIEGHPGASNEIALREASRLLGELDSGFVFVNLVETDQVYGHRKDVEGFHSALQAIDSELGRWLPQLAEGDLLILTADHGVDPAHPLSDHTREHAPLLALSGAMLRGGELAQAGVRHDGPLEDVGATVLAWLTGDDAAGLPGSSFLGASTMADAVIGGDSDA
jgi:phosphopentomutase